jgi:hypothetical protein
MPIDGKSSDGLWTSELKCFHFAMVFRLTQKNKYLAKRHPRNIPVKFTLTAQWFKRRILKYFPWVLCNNFDVQWQSS